jgi:hypothetical protein
MDAIFANAFLTIIAADGSHADCGLLRLQVHEAGAEHATTFVSHGVTISLLPPRRGVTQILPRTTWSTRGWTLQENLMSAKCLIFTEEEVFYNDNLYSVSESYESIDPQNYGDIQNSQRMTIDRLATTFELMGDREEWSELTYSDIVDGYTRRQLTHQGDRLDAFTGIASCLQPTVTSLAELIALSGLPRRHFVTTLFWRSNIPSTAIRQRVDARCMRCLPSWSWVGWSGSVHVPTYHRPSYSLQVVDRANITLGDFKHSFDISPTLQPIKEPLETVIHIWAETIPCAVTRVKQHSGYGAYRIGIAREQYAGSTELDDPTADGLLDDATQQFHHTEDLHEGHHYRLVTFQEAITRVHPTHIHFILVSTTEDPCERVTKVTYHRPLCQLLMLRLESMYIRLR